MTTTASACLLLLSGSAFAASPPAPDEDFTGHAKALDRIWAAGPTAVVARAPAPPAEAAGDIASLGQWLPPIEWDVIAIHSAMLSNGQVLQYSYPGGGPGSKARAPAATRTWTATPPSASSTSCLC